MKHIVLISGGKDSTATLFNVIEKIGKDKVIALFNNTGWEHSDTYKYIKDLIDFTGVEFFETKRTEQDFIKIIKEKLPNSRFRACSRELKERPTLHFIRQFKPETINLYIGVRKKESKARALRYEKLQNWSKIESSKYSIKSQKVFEIYPILDWTTEQVFEYIRSKGFYINPLYTKGFTRVGCYPCILKNKQEFNIIANTKYGQQRLYKLKVALLNNTKNFSLDKIFKQNANYKYVFKFTKDKND